MKEIVGFPMYTLHENGNIYSLYTKKFLSYTIDVTGYPIVVLVNSKGKFKKSIHRLLAEHYLENLENKPQVNHKNGVKTDFSLDNLEWVTAKENSLHAINSGLTKLRDESRYKEVAKISLETNEILEVYPSLTNAAKSNGLKQPNITKVCKGLRKSCGGYFWSFK